MKQLHGRGDTSTEFVRFRLLVRSVAAGHEISATKHPETPEISLTVPPETAPNTEAPGHSRLQLDDNLYEELWFFHHLKTDGGRVDHATTRQPDSN